MSSIGSVEERRKVTRQKGKKMSVCSNVSSVSSVDNPYIHLMHDRDR